jgi:hypothetical protein
MEFCCPTFVLVCDPEIGFELSTEFHPFSCGLWHSFLSDCFCR